MAIKTPTKTNIFLCMNLLCYVLTAAASCTCTAPSPPSPPPRRGGSGSSGGSAGGSGSIGVPGSSGASGSSGISDGTGGSSGTGSFGGSGTGQQPETCPIDVLKLGVCANLLGGLVGAVVGNPAATATPCCTVLTGLVDLEAAVCLCTAIRANLLGINLNVPVSLSALLNVCGRTPPPGFVCA